MRPGPRATRTHRLALTVQFASRSSRLPSPWQLRRWARAALAQDAAVTLRIVSQTEGRRLNREFRGKDYPTNVLTFTYSDQCPLTGDIVLCAPVVQREARQQQRSLKAHYAHLVVHGLLHLQGYDHQRAAQTRRMQSLESEIVTQLGYPDPNASLA